MSFAAPHSETISRSAAARRERARLRNHVLSGGSLTLLLREHHEAMDGVEIRKLVRWMPNVGEVKAHRVLLGLPERYTLGMLNPADWYRFTHRVASQERRLLARHINRRD